MKDEHSKYGDAIVVLGLAVWMSVAVGPWWVGVALFVAGFLVNLAVRMFVVVYLRKKRRP